ncbi:MAG: NTP transferase domain-containing protein, partial [Candidatus Eremiobacteraeota bacterium]|nr:NTP transferase domain-containing protein [Candidatus Eremiobacteraeota bacterium]
MSFPDKVEAVLLAGGQFKDLPPGEPVPPSKGLLPIGGRPMAARTLEALVGSQRVGRVIMVTSHSADHFTDPVWDGVDHLAAAGERLIDSFRAGMEAVDDPATPAMVVAGDLPFLTA